MMENATGALALDGFDLAIASVLVLVAGLVSAILRLGLARQLGIAAFRTVVQLLIIGYALNYVFGIESAWLVLGAALLMIGAASRAAVARSTRTFGGVGWLAFATLVATGLVTTFTVTGLVVGVSPWYRAQYVIPLLGMILGNGLTGLSLSLDHLLETLSEGRAKIETDLALGASAWEAAREPIREAVRRGLIPIINAMSVVGIVSLPGMMTGQILAGADPIDAVKYQIVVMFMIAGATSLGAMAITWLVFRRLFNERHQLVEGAIKRR